MTLTDTSPTASTRQASWRNLGLAYVAGFVLLAIQSTAYHHWSHGDNNLGGDLVFYLISGLLGVAIGAIALVRVHRSRSTGTAARVGIGLGALGLVIFPVAYFMPITVILGTTAHLLGRDAGPGRAASAARVIGLVAVLAQVAVVVARICGVTYQVGG